MAGKMALTVCLLAGCVWCFTLVERASSAPPSDAAAEFKPVASIETLMKGQDEQFQAIGELLDDPSIRGRTRKLVMRGELLAELANVNTYHRSDSDYRGWASDLRTASLALAAEAKKRKDADNEKMKELFAQLDTTCNACHDKYQ